MKMTPRHKLAKGLRQQGPKRESLYPRDASGLHLLFRCEPLRKVPFPKVETPFA